MTIQKLREKDLKGFSKKKLVQVVLEQNKALIELSNRIASLEKNSSNSSKPPSSDTSKPKRNQSLREKSDRKPGGQKGHVGKTREQVENPDDIVLCVSTECEACGKGLSPQEAKVIGKRQTIDIPPIVPFVTEYQMMETTCSCGHCNRGQYPENINAPMQIGPNIQSFLIYFNVSQLIPFERLTQVCDDIFNFPLCKRTIENTLEKGFEKGIDVHQDIMGILHRSLWVGSDETGEKVEGKKWWRWVWLNNKASYYVASPSRGYQVVKENFGESYIGKLIHDCWSAHNNTNADGGHQQCHPHLQRDAIFLHKTYNSRWAYDFNKFLGASQRARDKIWEDGFDKALRERIIDEYDKKLLEFIEVDEEEKKVHTLQKRIRKHKDSILLFMKCPDLPFHNNASERAIRMAKVKQKISGSFRSEHGAERHSVLLSVIETAKKQKMNILRAIQSLLNGELQFAG